MADDTKGRLTLTLRQGETATIDIDGETVEVKFVKAQGRNKASIQIVADRRHGVTRLDAAAGK